MKRLIFLVFFIQSLLGISQQRTTVGGNSFSINKSETLNGSYKLNNNLGGRYISIFDQEQKEVPVKIENYRLDIQSAIERRISANTKVGIGGLYRFSELDNRWRLFQQIGFAAPINFKIKGFHRIRMDETFEPNSVEFRLRYRYGIEIPLKGLEINEMEKFITIETEILLKTKSAKQSMEWRLNPVLGQLFKNKHKLEIGIDFRYDDPFQENEEKLFMLSLAYFL